MNVLHLGKYYPPALGGMEAHVRDLARGQAELGARPRVLAVRHDQGRTVEDRDGAVGVVRLRRSLRLGKFDLCPEVVMALREEVDRADVIHLHAPNPPMALALWRLQPRRPLVITHHTDIVRQKVAGLAFRPFDRHVYARAAMIWVTSPTYPGGSAQLRPFADRIRLLPHGIDLGPFVRPDERSRVAAAQIRARHGDAGPLWLACGRLTYYKGFLDAVRALPKAPGKLVIVGEGPERPRLEAEARRLGVADRLELVGAVREDRDVVPYYLAADGFWFPSCARTEAFGLAQVEAMAAGLAVINTAIPHSGVTWVAPPGRAALTVPVGDPDKLAAAARRLWEEPGLRRILGEAGRSRALARFDRRSMCQASLELCREAVEMSEGLAASRRRGYARRPPRERMPAER